MIAASGASMDAATPAIVDPSISTSPLAKLPTPSSIERMTPPLISVRRPFAPTPSGIALAAAP